MKNTRFIYGALFGLFLFTSLINMNGCALKPTIKEVNQSAPTINTDENQLSADFIYKYLVGEVAGQRGDLAASGSIFFDLAKTERDPRLAERAAKIAAYGNVTSLALPSVKLWAELDPDSTEAQQAMTEMLIAANNLTDAEPYLARILLKENTRAGGFLYLNMLLNRSADKSGILRLVQSLAKPYPNLAEAHFAIAQSAWAAGQDKVALQALDKAETLKPGWSVAALLKGQILFGQSPQTAINFYQNFLLAHPDESEIRLNLAKLMVNQKQYSAAKEEYPVIIESVKRSSSKNLADVIAVIGLLSYQSADYVAAYSYFQQALAADFKDADQLYIYLAQSAQKQNQEVLATSWFSKVNPGQHYLEAQIELANIMAKSQSIAKAIEKLDALEDLNTEQQIIVIQTEASILAKGKRNQDAFDLLDKAVKNLPNTPELVYDYALAAERLQKFDLMESELRKTIAAKPDFAAAYNALGYSLADRNVRLNEAIKLIETALIYSPNDHFMLDSLGWAHYRNGNLDKAIEYLQKAYEVDQDPEIAAHLGEVLWQKGRKIEALKIWNDALSSNPDNEVLLATTKKFKS